jgi:uncharacterized protein (DUF1800 family)
MLDVLALHPSTADHVARKLVRRFVGESLDRYGELIDRTARAFLDSGADIASTLRVILQDVSLGQNLEPKFKRPLNFVVSSLRMLDADTDGGPALQDRLAAMGHLPFAWATPDGPTDEAAPWKGGLISRWQFALDLVSGQLDGTHSPLGPWMEAAGPTTPEAWMDSFGVLLLGKEPDEDSRTALRSIASGDEALLVAGLLSSPAFQWR